MRPWPIAAVTAAAILSAVGTGVTVAQTPLQTQPPAAQSQPGGPKMEDDGMGDGWGKPFRRHHHHEHGMRGMGMGAGMQMPCGPAAAITPETVSRRITQRLERRGNQRVKLGAVAEAADGVITAEIVTVKEGALVDRFAIDPKTGRWQRIE